MKGKISLRFAMPNLQRFRSRVEKPEATLTKQIREKLAEVAANVLNRSLLQVRAEMIEYIDSLTLEYKTPQHKAKVMSIIEPFFDAVFAETPEKLAELCPESAAEKEEGENDQEGTVPAPAEGEVPAPAEGEVPAPDSEDFE